MANKEKKQENILVKIYILGLFVCGIGLWFAVSGVPKHKVSADIELEQKVTDILFTNGVKQTDIISQYTRERETTTKVWNEFYKKIRLCGEQNSDNFESPLRALARSMKLGLSKTDNVDGTVTYKFYSLNMNYSNITFINPKKPVSLTAAAEKALSSAAGGVKKSETGRLKTPASADGKGKRKSGK